jgi:SulP family sulfate permease
VGEVGMYLEQPRTATITATEPTVIHRLYANSMKEMEQKNPEVAARMHRWLAATLSQRLASNSQTLEVLLN